MATAIIDGIRTRYELIGAGPALLMLAPGGFDGTIEKWRAQGIYARLNFLDHLKEHFTCVLFDRREAGASGGRVERVTWSHYAAQGVGLLDHLGIEQAHVMGGCMGSNAAAAVGVAHSSRVLSMVLFWPMGGAKYRINGYQRFSEHLAFVRQNGLQAVVDLAIREGKPFGQDPRGGPWVAVIKQDPAFALCFAKEDVDRYCFVVVGMMRSMFDRDTAPGVEAEDLLRLRVPALVIPGADASHATSAARHLAECLPGADYWDAPVAEQNEAGTNDRVLAFLLAADAAAARGRQGT